MNKLFAIAILLAACIVPSARALDLNQGEIVNVWIQVEERTGTAFTISTGNYSVIDRDGYNLQSEATATIDNTNHYVYGLVNTSTAPFTDGLNALVKYRYTIGSEVYLYYLPITIHSLIYGQP